MLRRLLTLIRKELQTILGDKQGRFLVVMPVILQLALFPLAATLEIKNATLGIYDQDGGPAAIELTQRLRAQALTFTRFIDITNEQQLNDTIEQQHALAVIRIPPDFSAQLARATGTPQLQLLLDGRRTNAAQIAATHIQQIVQLYQQDHATQRSGAGTTTAPLWSAVAEVASATGDTALGDSRIVQTSPTPQSGVAGLRPLPPHSKEEATAAATPAAPAPTAPSELTVQHWFNPNLDFLAYVLPSLIAIITTLGVLIVTTLSVAREREQGTFEQLLVSPYTPEMIMAGKIVPALLIASFQATLILVASVFIYGVPFQGSLLLLYAAFILYALALAGVGLFISSLCATQQQAFISMFAFIMPAIMLSGFAAPIENMPHWLQHFTWINPIRHFMEVVKAIYLKNATPAHVAALAWPLLVIGAMNLAIADILFRKKNT